MDDEDEDEDENGAGHHEPDEYENEYPELYDDDVDDKGKGTAY